MGSNLLGGDNMVSQLTSWKAQQDGESEDSSFTSCSSMSNFKSPSASLNEIDEYMYMLSEGGAGAGHANEYHDEMRYQRLPNLLEQPLLSIANTSLHPSITKDHYLIKHEEALKNTFFSMNPLDPKTLPFPLDFHHHTKANSTLAPSFMRSVEQAYDQTLHMDHAQVPLKSDYASLHDPPSSPSPFVSISDDSYTKHFLIDSYGARQAGQNPDVECHTQPSNEALETTSNGTYNVPYLPCTSFTTSPPLPSIISTNSSPITSLASNTSTIADTASMDAPASLPPTRCRDNLFVNGSEMMPCLITLPTRSSLTRTSKGKNVENDKVHKKKRKRTRSRKNSEELESQRMTHIAVERNRRRQMNQHLNDLRSLMPSSYIQRGDQASIVGGAIRLVEELEQVLESLHLQKQIAGGATSQQVPLSHLDNDKSVSIGKDSYACLQTSMVNVQVEMISLSSILVKVMAPKRHHQLLHTLQALSFLSLKVLHLNITTFDISILYSFNLKMENNCQFQTALELAKSIQHVFDTPDMEYQ